MLLSRVWHGEYLLKSGSDGFDGFPELEEVIYLEFEELDLELVFH